MIGVYTANMQDYLEEIEKYYDINGFVKNSPSDNGVDGNAWLYTSIDIITQIDLDVLTIERANRFMSLLSLHRAGAGMWWRAGKIGDDQNHDDIIGIVTALDVLGSWLLRKGLDDLGRKAFMMADAPGVAGMENNWIYEYKKGGIKQLFSNWWWPIFGPTDYFKAVTTGHISWFNHLRLMLGVWSTSLKPVNATSGRQLDWLICRGLKENGIGKDIIRSFENKIKMDYPPSGRMGLVFGIYYRDARHPFAKAYSGKIFLK